MASKGWWGMSCWNALSKRQQRQLIERGTLEIFSKPEGDACDQAAAVMVECQDDEAPGPRFYCLPCAILFLSGKVHQEAVSGG